MPSYAMGHFIQLQLGWLLGFFEHEQVIVMRRKHPD